MNKLDKDNVIGIAALLVHAANIDEIYSDHEKDLIKVFITSWILWSGLNKINLLVIISETINLLGLTLFV